MSRQDFIMMRKGLKYDNPGVLNVFTFLRQVEKLQPVNAIELSEERKSNLERVNRYVNFCLYHSLIKINSYGRIWGESPNVRYSLTKRGIIYLQAFHSERPRELIIPP